MSLWKWVWIVLMIPGMSRASDIITQDVEYQVNGVALKGYLARPADPGAVKRGVLVVHEWWGLNDYPRMRADRLARELGCVAFALDMYGADRTTSSPDEAGKMAGEISGNPSEYRARLEAGLDQLRKASGLPDDQLFAIGYCFGGTAVMNLARWGTPIKGVVSFHGSLATRTPAEPGKVKARILVLHGEADTLIPASDIENFKREMASAGAPMTWISYPNAKHAFTNPNADNVGIDGVGYDADADARSWEAMKEFFETP